jgi:plasmid maintenance system antidote protein VapI
MLAVEINDSEVIGLSESEAVTQAASARLATLFGVSTDIWKPIRNMPSDMTASSCTCDR